MENTGSYKEKRVCVVGLGYVGYPLARAFSHHIETIGFDIDERKLNLYRTETDHHIKLTSDPTDIKKADIIIIAVPTPVTRSKNPDLSYIQSSAKIVASNMKKGAVIVLESTVYPGLTEQVFIPLIEEGSGCHCGTDFSVGYSPERINPGDDEHSLEKITKIVSGINAETAALLKELYGSICNVYVAESIQIAESAKVIENIQRDLNIALMNELSIIFHHLNLDTRAIIRAASTKWNFIPFSPGLVGGHCIPVDPYYLVYKAEELGYHPQVILAGRSINDNMPGYVAKMVIMGLNQAEKVLKKSKVLVMGLTYKENVPDIRESPAFQLIESLKKYQIEVYGFEPLLSEEIIATFGIQTGKLSEGIYDAIILNVPHDQFKQIPIDGYIKACRSNPVIIDVKGVLEISKEKHNEIYYATL